MLSSEREIVRMLLNPQLADSKSPALGNSLAVQWLGLGAFTAVTGIQSLVGELRYCEPCGAAKKKILLFPSLL